ncbi:AAA family ATPase [Priestia sp. YIM B13486]|uniref:AAA family ATPase n=1 Tax=Priestia sp. YIM B13486 TaxID=3366304 RepID=UPI003671B59D
MKRLLIEKLIVISDNEQKSKEINFEKGLNIIIGKNKTGKSSLIKSIFYAFGCEVKMEADWKKI